MFGSISILRAPSQKNGWNPLNRQLGRIEMIEFVLFGYYKYSIHVMRPTPGLNHGLRRTKPMLCLDTRDIGAAIGPRRHVDERDHQQHNNDCSDDPRRPNLLQICSACDEYNSELSTVTH